MRERDKKNWKNKEALWNVPEVPLLREGLQKKGIKVVLFDLDDTLTKTYFTEGRMIYLEALEELSGRKIEPKAFMKKWHDIFLAHKPISGVHPQGHEDISRRTAEEYGVVFEDERVQAAFKEMWRVIYEVVPENMPGAFEAVQMLKAAGAEVGVVTHAQYDWTWLKLSNWRGEFRHVHCVDVIGQKGPVEWMEGIMKFGVRPWECVVVGDSEYSDMWPAHQAGVERLFRMAASFGATTKDLPEGTQEIFDLREMISHLINED